MWVSYMDSKGKIPQRLQSLVLREYFAANKQDYKLARTELGSSQIVLKDLLKDHHNFHAAILFSFEQIDISFKEFEALAGDFINAGKEIHFAYENIQIRSSGQLNKLEDSFLLRDLEASPQQMQRLYETNDESK